MHVLYVKLINLKYATKNASTWIFVINAKANEEIKDIVQLALANNKIQTEFLLIKKHL